MKKFLTVLVMLIFTAGVWAANYTVQKFIAKQDSRNYLMNILLYL